MAEVRSDGGLQSVSAALDLLGYFSSAEELGVTEIARRMGVAKSTAHRLLTTLCAGGFVERDAGTGRYRLGMKLYELGQLAVSRSRIHQTAVPMLAELHELTGGTVHLAIPDGAEIVYVERLVATSSARASSGFARRLPAHCTSSGKAIAAFDQRVASARSLAGFSPLTGRSIHSARDFARELTETRRRGYAVSIDEAYVGFGSVAAPVLAHDGSARAAISVVVPSSRLRADTDRPARLVRLTAQRLAKQLCL
jgi:DNA-binding IclR family transcriptional regulator